MDSFWFESLSNRMNLNLYRVLGISLITRLQPATLTHTHNSVWLTGPGLGCSHLGLPAGSLTFHICATTAAKLLREGRFIWFRFLRLLTLFVRAMLH